MTRGHRRLLCGWLVAVMIASVLGCGSATNELADRKLDSQKSSVAPESSASSVTEPKKLEELTIAAASDLKFVLDELAEAFQKTRPEITIKTTFGSSGNLFAQITNDAPFDLFLAADIQYAHDLAEQGKGRKEDVFAYAQGHIVVWVPATSELDLEELGIQAVLDVRVKKVAIANPKHAPYGRAAEATLKSLGVYEQVSRKLVLGENIAQTTQFVESGAADVGLIALSLAMAPAMKDKGRFWQVPFNAYPQLLQGGIILNRCEDPEAANEFKAYLIGEEGRSTLRKYGFGLPGE